MAPKLTIIDAEQMSMDVRQDLASFLYNTLNASRETAFEVVGLDVRSERAKREAENEKGYDAIFVPYKTAYTRSGNDGAGRPTNEDGDLDKQEYDRQYTEDVR